jgi:hypothetical protein
MERFSMRTTVLSAYATKAGFWAMVDIEDSLEVVGTDLTVSIFAPYWFLEQEQQL